MTTRMPEAIKFSRQFIKEYEVGVTLLKGRFVEESMSQGSTATFDVVPPGGRMRKRSMDGRIPRKNIASRQVPVILEEFVDKYEVTDFEKFVSQSDERSKMNSWIGSSLNEEIDYKIKEALAKGTNEFAAAASTITLGKATDAIARLAEKKIPISMNDVTWIISPKMEAFLQNIPAYTSSDYVSSRKLEGAGNQWSGERKIKDWLNVGWIVDPNLPGVGSASCTTYLAHRNAIGCAVPTNMMNYGSGWDDKDLYYYCSANLKTGTEILQDPGVLKFYHDDTATP